MGGSISKTSAWEKEGLEDFKFQQVDIKSFEEPKRQWRWKLLRARSYIPYLQFLIDVAVAISLHLSNDRSWLLLLFVLTVVVNLTLRNRDRLRANEIIESQDISDAFIDPATNFKRARASFGEYCLFKRIDEELIGDLNKARAFLKALDSKYFVLLVFAPQLLVSFVHFQDTKSDAYHDCRLEYEIPDASREDLDKLGCVAKRDYKTWAIYLKTMILVSRFLFLIVCLALIPFVRCAVMAKMQSLSMSLRTYTAFRVIMLDTFLSISEPHINAFSVHGVFTGGSGHQ